MTYMSLSKNSLIHLFFLQGTFYRVTILHLALYSLMGARLLTRLTCVCPYGAHREDRHVDKHGDQMC